MKFCIKGRRRLLSHGEVKWGRAGRMQGDTVMPSTRFSFRNSKADRIQRNMVLASQHVYLGLHREAMGKQCSAGHDSKMFPHSRRSYLVPVKRTQADQQSPMIPSDALSWGTRTRQSCWSPQNARVRREPQAAPAHSGHDAHNNPSV